MACEHIISAVIRRSRRSLLVWRLLSVVTESYRLKVFLGATFGPILGSTSCFGARHRTAAAAYRRASIFVNMALGSNVRRRWLLGNVLLSGGTRQSALDALMIAVKLGNVIPMRLGLRPAVFVNSGRILNDCVVWLSTMFETLSAPRGALRGVIWLLAQLLSRGRVPAKARFIGVYIIQLMIIRYCLPTYLQLDFTEGTHNCNISIHHLLSISRLKIGFILIVIMAVIFMIIELIISIIS